MTPEDFKKCRRFVNSETTRTYYNTEDKYPIKKLPLSERWSARDFNFDTVFKEVSEDSSFEIKTEWFFQIDSWHGYAEYISNENHIEMPKEPLTSPHKHAKLVYTKGEE